MAEAAVEIAMNLMDEVDRLKLERDELRQALARLLSWVDSLPVKHPQQAEARAAAHRLLTERE